MGDEKYCYQPEGKVLINKLNIRDQADLQLAERRISSQRQASLIKRPVKGNFDLDHLCKIHKRLFSDLYSWAGKTRNVDIAKVNTFCRVSMLPAFADSIFEELRLADHLHGRSREAFVKDFTRFYADVNCLHPFREGNGRTQREFFRELALENGYILNFSEINKEDFIQASIVSFQGSMEEFEKIFDKALEEIGQRKVSVKEKAEKFEFEMEM